MVKVRVSTRADLSLIEDDLAESIEDYLAESAEALTDRQRAAVCSRLAEMAASLMQKIQRNVTLDDGELPDSEDDEEEDDEEEEDDDDNDQKEEEEANKDQDRKVKGEDRQQQQETAAMMRPRKTKTNKRRKYRQVELADVLQGDDESRALEAQIVQLVEQLMKARQEVPERLAAEANAQLIENEDQEKKNNNEENEQGGSKGTDGQEKQEQEQAQDKHTPDPAAAAATTTTTSDARDDNSAQAQGESLFSASGCDENSVPPASDIVQLLQNAKEMLPRIKETLEIQRIKLEKIVSEAESEQRDRTERPFTTPERVLMSSQAENRGENESGNRQQQQE